MTQKESRSPLYMIWSSMKRRCENPNMPNYKYYGAKGIKVCGEWHSFPKFKEWAKANGYVDGLSLDRIDLPEKASLLHGCAVKKLTSLAAVGRFLSTYRLQANKYHTAICCGNHRPEPFGVSGHAPSSPRHRTRHTSLTVGQHCNTVTARTFSVRIRARPRGKDMS